MGCCYCEGCYLTPQQRKMENPRLGLHISCYLEIMRTVDDIETMRKFLKENSRDIEILRARLQNMDDFWNRMERIKKFWKEVRESQQSAIHIQSKEEDKP